MKSLPYRSCSTCWTCPDASSPLTDAMGCQKKIARQIVNREADYILAVKENQRRLLEDVTRPVFLWAENRI